MKRANVLAAPLLLAGAIASAVPAAAQVTVGADLGLNSRYMFWGLTLSNRPVADVPFTRVTPGNYHPVWVWPCGLSTPIVVMRMERAFLPCE